MDIWVMCCHYSLASTGETQLRSARLPPDALDANRSATQSVTARAIHLSFTRGVVRSSEVRQAPERRQGGRLRTVKGEMSAGVIRLTDADK
jgi:hypothetical protein